MSCVGTVQPGEQDSSVIKSTGFVTERLQVQIQAGAAGEFSSPESTFCMRSTPTLPHQHIKHPSHSAKCIGYS